eukprot:CAMPEP_0117672708 /NCGR_PEP_ID=MMETSP0804-20121206/14060_1 /TAXON_ID=1074897 /ORGANISM="Tetraselmis astigmatica, Strain CCMP880" /LENGTH=474 /DNA_ID=CAMNT_0005481351 /DNA_START=23 /DNA_END=1450 /DNA_ORIENTATION=+
MGEEAEEEGQVPCARECECQGVALLTAALVGGAAPEASAFPDLCGNLARLLRLWHGMDQLGVGEVAVQPALLQPPSWKQGAIWQWPPPEDRATGFHIQPSVKGSKQQQERLCDHGGGTATSIASVPGPPFPRRQLGYPALFTSAAAELSVRPSGTTDAPHVIMSNDRDGRPTFPPAGPITTAEVEQLADFIRDSQNLLVITGAGCSTESNIPDYRSPTGAYSSGYKPMTHQQFMAKEVNRSRYWQRSCAGYHEFASTACNPAHHALAQLQEMGWVKGLITQNVDRLHHKAGSRDVVELHGTTHRVVCMSCEATMDRKSLQEIFEDINADIIAASALGNANSDPALEGPQGVKRPDGDKDAQLSQDFRVPPCRHCDGVLKPAVVFFGANVPKETADQALRMAEENDAILVVGSSLMVYSVFRLIKAAKANGANLAILTVGPTRADDLADLKLEYLAGEALARVSRHPTLAIPPGR